VDDNAALSERYGVRTSPTLLFFKSGTVVASRTGVDRRQVIKKLIEEYA
jgi:thioredoxin 1